MKPIDFGDFTLVETMGHGGMATVYRGVRKDNGETVAIKIFKETEDRPLDVIRRLRDREVKMMVAIQHENVVKFIEYGDFNDKYYYVMEFVELSLLGIIKNEQLSFTQKIDLLYQTTLGLQAIHHQGVVHRDVKPGNILLTPVKNADGNDRYIVKITDLGIAKNVSETDVVTTVASKRIPGTPKYLSPEQIELKPVDGRSDIFSLGVMAYELLTGETPFEAGTSDEFMKANVEQETRPLHDINPDVPQFLSDLTAKMLSKDRELRYDSDTLENDFKLVLNHLETNAPLLEHTNPSSIFYVPPPPSAQKASVLTPKRKTLAPVSWAAVAVVALAAFVIVSLRWPRLNAADLPKPVVLPSSYRLPKLTTDQELALAEKLAPTAEGQWHAYELLSDMSPDALSEEQKAKRLELLGSVETALAAPFVKHTEELIKGGVTGKPKVKEAKANVDRIHRLFPEYTGMEALDKQIGRLVAENDTRYRYRATRIIVSRMLKDRKYGEAITEWSGFIGRHKGTSYIDKAAKQVEELVLAWGHALEKDGLTESKIKDFVTQVRQLQKQTWAKGVRDIGGALYLALADKMMEKGDEKNAVRLYKKIREEYPATDEAVAAGRRLQKMQQELTKTPIAQLRFAQDLKVLGYTAPFWQKEAAAGTTIDAKRDTLTLRVKGGAQPVRAQYSMVRFSQNVGFELKVPLRLKLDHGNRDNATFEAGVQLLDANGNLVQLNAERNGFKIGIKQSGKLKPATNLVFPFVIFSDAFKEYPLSLRYDSIDGRLEVYVNQKKEKTLRTTVGSFKIILFVEFKGDGTLSAEFGAISCAPIE